MAGDLEPIMNEKESLLPTCSGHSYERNESLLGTCLGHATEVVPNPRLRVCPIAATMIFRYCSNRTPLVESAWPALPHFFTVRSRIGMGAVLDMLRSVKNGGAGGNRTHVSLRSRVGSSERSKPNQPQMRKNVRRYQAAAVLASDGFIRSALACPIVSHATIIHTYRLRQGRNLRFF